MKFRSLSATLALLGLLVVTPGCKDFFDVNVDPLHPTVATEDQLLPGTQLAMATYLGLSLEGLGQATSTLIGQLNSSRGIGSFQQTGGSFNNQWDGLYEDMLENNELIIQQTNKKITLAADDKGKNSSRGYLGIAQLQKAYVFSIMADMWGSIPYSEALQAVANRQPRFDSDRDIYLGNPDKNIQGLFALIDDGLNNMQQSTTSVRGDLIYGGDKVKWMAFGRTLKLKLYNQIRLVQDPSPLVVSLRDSVTALLTNGGATPTTKPLMTNTGDFEFAFGNSIQPENRNVLFLADYVNPTREDYINQDFISYMANRGDPRINFYFYNQSPTPPTGTPVGYTITGQAPNVLGGFGTVPLGSSSTQASGDNNSVITLPGLYPAGGRYNDGTFAPAGSKGANYTFGHGTVPQRFLTTFNRYFIEAELQLTLLNNPAAATTALRSGVQEAFNKVAKVAADDGAPTSINGSSTVIPNLLTLARTPAYITAAVTRFNGAASPEAKLSVIMQEKYVASFGFGEDIWTDYRRTGLPNTNPAYSPPVQPDAFGILTRAPGEVPNTVATGSRPNLLFYSQSDLTLNPNAPPQHRSERPFWMP